MPKIAIIDYGVGNLFSLASSLKYLGYETSVTADENTLKNATHIILPGVGAFEDAIKKLELTGLIPVLKQQVEQQKPLLGICLGMQLLFEKSFEYGVHTGLCFINGEVHPIIPDLNLRGYEYKVPHMGWNNLEVKQKNSAIMKNTDNGDSVYFVHSFYAKKCDSAVVATAEYGIELTAAVSNGNVHGCQFHPEKSGEKGLAILRAFAEI